MGDIDTRMSYYELLSSWLASQDPSDDIYQEKFGAIVYDLNAVVQNINSSSFIKRFKIRKVSRKVESLFKEVSIIKVKMYLSDDYLENKCEVIVEYVDEISGKLKKDFITTKKMDQIRDEINALIVMLELSEE